jgi:hypothetical protein
MKLAIDQNGNYDHFCPISEQPYTLMQGREMTPEKRKRPTHKDTVLVELAEDEYKED